MRHLLSFVILHIHRAVAHLAGPRATSDTGAIASQAWKTHPNSGETYATRNPLTPNRMHRSPLKRRVGLSRFALEVSLQPQRMT